MSQILCQRTGAAGKALLAADSAEDQRMLLELGTAAIANSGDFAAAGHHVNHQHGGSDEIATATPSANSIPKAGAGGTLAVGWMPLGTSSSTVCVGNDSRLNDGRTPIDNSVTTAKIADDQVTFAKFQNVASQRLLGRQASSSGDAAEISIAAGDGISLDWSTTNTLTIAATGGGGGGSGSVESVGLNAPSFLSVSGSPVTTTGTLELALANQSAHSFMAGPGDSGSAPPTFRTIVADDIPQQLRSQHVFRSETDGLQQIFYFDARHSWPTTPGYISSWIWTASTNSTDPERTNCDEGYPFASLMLESTNVTTDSHTAKLTIAANEIILYASSVKVGGSTVLVDNSVGSMAFEVASNYTPTSSLGSMAFASTGDYTPTSGFGSAAFASTSDFIATASVTSIGNDLITATDPAAARAAIGVGAGDGTVTSVDITPPGAGITASGGPITAAGSITLALANDLAAIEGLASTGYAKRTGTDAWSQTATIPIADGGTNSTAALNNNRLMKSSSGAIVEMGAMTDGQLVVGVTSAAPAIVSVSGDLTLSNAGAAAIPTSVLSTAARTVTDDATTGAMLQTLGRSRKNAIINGDMVISQRGAQTVTTGQTKYTLDRWFLQNATSAGSLTVTQESMGSSYDAGVQFPVWLKVLVGTADNSLGAGEYATLCQSIEGYVWRHFAQKALTLSFWVRSPKTGTHSVLLQNPSTGDRRFVGEYSVGVANTWEFKVISIAASPGSGTWYYANEASLAICFCLCGGSSVIGATAGSWLTNSSTFMSTQPNCMDTNNNVFGITGVQLEVGNGFSGFEMQTYAEQLADCQRYFQKHNNQSAPINTNNDVDWLVCPGSSIANGEYYARIALWRPMRTAPTVTVYSYTSTANTGQASNDGGSDYGAGSAQVNFANEKFFVVRNNKGSSLTVGSQKLIFMGWHASAEL